VAEEEEETKRREERGRDEKEVIQFRFQGLKRRFSKGKAHGSLQDHRGRRR